MTDRPHLDLILLKLTDELVKVDKDPVVAQIVENARKLSVVYPQAVLVDPIDAQAGTIDRESMHRFFQKINALPNGTFHFLVLYTGLSLGWLQSDFLLHMAPIIGKCEISYGEIGRIGQSENVPNGVIRTL